MGVFSFRSQSEFGMRATQLKFPTWFDFLEEAIRSGHDRDGGHIALEDRVSQEVVSGDNPWHGTESFQDAVTLARKGWPEGVQEIEHIKSATWREMSSLIVHPEMRYREEPGIAVDIPRFLNGEPQHWIDVRDLVREGMGRNVLRFVYNISAGSTVSPQIITAKGATVAALINLLELSGVQVQLDCVLTAEGWNRDTLEVYITVKPADQMLDMFTLALAIAHPSTLRRFGFAIMESLEKDIADELGVGSTYGEPGRPTETGDLYIAAATAQDKMWLNETEAREWIITTMKQQGVITKEEVAS